MPESRRPPEAARILAVDDEPSLLHFYERTLSAHGYSVVTAENAEEALRALDAGGPPFDVIVSDLWMPGKTGLDLLREVRVRDLDLPLMIVTAAPDLETALRALDEGVLRYLLKPVRGEQLVEAVRRAVALHRMSRLKRQALEMMQHPGNEPGDRASLRISFDRALAAMTLDYQPVIDPASRVVFGFEALLRPQDPAFAGPPQMLDAAERLGLLNSLGRRVREIAAGDAPRLARGVNLLVNLHPRDLLDEQLYDAAAPLTAVAEQVILEITERSLLEEVPSAHARVERLRGLGYRLAIDDLGAGYAGLNSWAQLEPDLVKLDMALVRDIHRMPTKRSLVKAMIDVCRDLDVRLIAEGIETVEERDALRDLQCPLMQGYYFARPGPAFPEPRFG